MSSTVCSYHIHGNAPAAANEEELCSPVATAARSLGLLLHVASQLTLVTVFLRLVAVDLPGASESHIPVAKLANCCCLLLAVAHLLMMTVSADSVDLCRA